MPFDEYLALPGHSHSSIVSAGVAIKSPTKKMQLGTKVHNYLLEPAKYDHTDADIVKPLARSLKQDLEAILPYLLPEVGITADFIYNGLKMAYKGRADLVKPGKILIDLKVSEMPLRLAMERFGYGNQLSGYALAFGCQAAVLKCINPKTKQIDTANILISQGFWIEQTLRHGEPTI